MPHYVIRSLQIIHNAITEYTFQLCILNQKLNKLVFKKFRVFKSWVHGYKNHICENKFSYRFLFQKRHVFFDSYW